MPCTVAAVIAPARNGSSLNDSNPRPPSGDRCMLVVGPRMTEAPLAIASEACRAPPSWMSAVSHVAASAVPWILSVRKIDEKQSNTGKTNTGKASGGNAIEESCSPNAVRTICQADRFDVQTRYRCGMPEVDSCCDL